MYQDNDDINSQGGEGGGKEDVRVAIDKSFALEMKKRFGQEDDFDDGLFILCLLYTSPSPRDS